MSKQIRLVAILFGIVILLSLGIVGLDATEIMRDDGSVVLRDSPPTDVRTVTISNAHGEMFIDYMDGGYVVGDVPIDVVDMDKFVSMMTYSGAVCAANTIHYPEDLSRYGLDGDGPAVAVTYADGESIKLYIGSREPISKGYYCRVEGDKNVYLFEEPRISAYLEPPKYYISTYVTPPIPPQSQSALGHVRTAEFEGGALAKPVKLTPVTEDDAQSMLEALSYGSATHLIKMRDRNYRVDQKYAEEVFGSLVGLKATDIVGYHLSAEEISDFGFDKPSMTVRFDFVPEPGEEPTAYCVSLLEKNGLFYAVCNDRGIIYEIERPLFYMAELEKFPVRWFFSPLLFDIDELEIAVGEQAYLFKITGSTNDDLAVTCNGDAFDLDCFRKFYKLVTSAAHDNEMIDSLTVDGEPLMQITYRYRNKDKQEDRLVLYPAEARRHYAKVNGSIDFTIKEQFMTRVAQALDVLFTDQDFEIDW